MTDILDSPPWGALKTLESLGKLQQSGSEGKKMGINTLHALDTISPHFATALMIWFPENTVCNPQSKFQYSIWSQRVVTI